jgi:Uma2 family endonuclease
MAIEQRISEAEYQEFVFAHPDSQWELVDGVLREKPGMSWEHADIVMHLGTLLSNQLDRREYRVFAESRVRRPAATIFIPDLFVVPTAYGAEFRGRPGTLAIFSAPLPLVFEVWSASTGEYDVDTKIPVYQQRGDREIWRIHPYERILTSWRRQSDGSYLETVYREGIVRPASLPGVAIDLSEVFDD